MSLIRLNAVGMEFDDTVVLREAFLKLREGDRVGLVGRNGTGKTTFLELILGRKEPTTGTVERNLGLTVGYFSQFSELEGHLSVVDELSNLFPEVHATQARLDAIGERLGEAVPDDEMNRLLSEQAELFERMDALDGWSYENTIDTVLTRLGFDAERRVLPVDRLSGGWRNRAALARILVQGPDVLLLDEPTNHLDVSAQLSLLAFVRDLGITSVAALHDLNLAAAFCEHVLVLSDGRLVAAGHPADVLVPDLIRDVYGVEADVLSHPRTGRPVIAFHEPARARHQENAR